MTAYRTIVVGTDGSDSSYVAVDTPTGPEVWRVPGLRATAGSRPRKYPESRR